MPLLCWSTQRWQRISKFLSVLGSSAVSCQAESELALDQQYAKISFLENNHHASRRRSMVGMGLPGGAFRGAPVFSARWARLDASLLIQVRKES
jgi:hypothetical protein